jgi:hypothetical protein
MGVVLQVSANLCLTRLTARVGVHLEIHGLSLQANMSAAGEEQRRLAERFRQVVVEGTCRSAQCVQQQLGEWYAGGAASQRTTQDKQRLLGELQLLRHRSHEISDACLISEVLCAL